MNEKIVIIRAGFGGLAAAKALRHSNAEICPLLFMIVGEAVCLRFRGCAILIRIRSATIHFTGQGQLLWVGVACSTLLDGDLAWYPLTSEIGPAGLKQATQANRLNLRKPLNTRVSGKGKKQRGDVVQLVRTLPCHGRGRGFESRRPRQFFSAACTRRNGASERFSLALTVQPQ
jgi:hypothetical protein